MKRLYPICKIIFNAVLFLAVSCVSSDYSDPLPVKQVEGFDISDVRLLEGPFKTAQKLNEKYFALKGLKNPTTNNRHVVVDKR